MDSPYLGFGMVYYGIVHALRAEMCVCLGSGGGFVPRVMRQGQRDLGLVDAVTILIDADMPESGWGRPDWVDDANSFFRQHFADINWWKQTTEEAARRFNADQIDYLHIDADHRRTTKDFQLYAPLVRIGGAVTVHDTITAGGCDAGKCVEHIESLGGWKVVNFSDIGAGIALARRKE